MVAGATIRNPHRSTRQPRATSSFVPALADPLPCCDAGWDGATGRASVSTQAGPVLKVGIGGLGTIGAPVARWLAGAPQGLRLVAISARNRERAAERLSALGIEVPVVAAGALARPAGVGVRGRAPAPLGATPPPAAPAGRPLFVARGGAVP